MDYAEAQAAFLQQLDPGGQLFELFDCLPGLSFFVKDRRGRFIALNQRGCEYCGVGSEAEAIGKTDLDFFPAQRAKEYRADDRKVMKSGKAIHNRLESAPEDEGSPRLVITSKVPLRNKQGNVIGVAGFSRQVDQLRQPSGTINAFASVIQYMHEHFADRLTSDELAEMAGVSPSQFDRRFRRAFGTSAHQYLLKIRIENASQRLAQSEASITDISLECGFYDHAHFSRTFRRMTNFSPTQYRSIHLMAAQTHRKYPPGRA